MRGNLKKIIGGGVATLVIIVLGLAWWLGYFSSEPEAATLDAAVEAIGGDATTDDDAEDNAGSDETSSDDDAASDGTADGSTNGTTAEVDEAISIDGTWSVQTGDATFVGYRVEEVLSGVGDVTAVGRTPAVTGTLQAAGTTITEVSIVADLTQLASDSSARDGQMKSQSLETDTFPEGTFTLTSPIEVGAVPTGGDTATFTALGDLTLHGVTNSIELQVEATVVAESIVIVGSANIAMSDYGINPPSAPIVARVEDVGVMEVSLVFAR